MPAHLEQHRQPAPRRPRTLNLRFTNAEYQELQERAGRSTHGNMGEYLRSAAFGRRMDPLSPPPPQINRDAYLAFLRVGALLNQTARHLHVGNVIGTDRDKAAFHQLLTDLTAAVEEVRRLLAR